MSMKAKDDRLIYLVFTVQHGLRMHIWEQLTAAGVKITVEQAGILFLLEEKNGRAMSELSRLLLLDNSRKEEIESFKRILSSLVVKFRKA